jgi:cellulose biosynthesis protein BcsQ
MQIHPSSLKATRERIGLTIEEAAQSIHVQKRTWQAYEAPRDLKSSRPISPPHLELFCLKNNLPFPPVRLDGSPTVGDTRIVSVLGSTGGCGKTWISLEVARTLARAGYRSAVVTDADYLTMENFLFSNPFVYRRSNVLLRDSELKDLKIRLRALGLLDDRGHYQSKGGFIDYFEGKAWHRKSKPEATLEQLRRETDFVLLDLGRNLETALLLSDVVIFIFDLERSDAFHSNLNVFGSRLLRNAEPGASPKLFTLLTNKKPSRRQDDAYAAAHQLGLPIMHTTLSNAQTLARRRVEAKFFAENDFKHRPWKFELITDVESGSIAALEYLSLADELLVELNNIQRLKDRQPGQVTG